MFLCFLCSLEQPTSAALAVADSLLTSVLKLVQRLYMRKSLRAFTNLMLVSRQALAGASSAEHQKNALLKEQCCTLPVEDLSNQEACPTPIRHCEHHSHICTARAELIGARRQRKQHLERVQCRPHVAGVAPDAGKVGLVGHPGPSALIPQTSTRCLNEPLLCQ